MTNIKNQTKRVRITWIDHVKTMGIFFVVYGHSLSTSWGIGHWIFSFHMPMFFFISGYLLRKSNASEGILSIARKQFYSLVPAYIVFSLVGYAFWFSVDRNFGVNADDVVYPIRTFLMIFYGSGTGELFHVKPVNLWFFPCLLIAQIIIAYTLRFPLKVQFLLSAMLCLLGLFMPTSIILPFELETALVAQVFVFSGYVFKAKSWLKEIEKWNIKYALFLLCVGGALASINGSIDMRISIYSNILLFFISSHLTILGLSALLAKLDSHRLSSWISKNTIIIFPTHHIVFTLFSGIYVYVLKLDLAVREDAIVGLVASAMNVMFIMFFIVPICQKYLPVIYGLKSGEKSQLSR